MLARHVLPNAFAPTLTLIGLVLGKLLGGIAVMETVFTLPGLGRLLVDSIYARDCPVVQGVMLFTAFIYVLVNLLVDLAYPLFDPRVAGSEPTRARVRHLASHAGGVGRCGSARTSSSAACSSAPSP